MQIYVCLLAIMLYAQIVHNTERPLCASQTGKLRIQQQSFDRDAYMYGQFYPRIPDVDTTAFNDNIFVAVILFNSTM